MQDARKPPDAARNGGEASGGAAAHPLAVNSYLRLLLLQQLLDNPGTNASRTNALRRSASRHERSLPANGCTRARSLSDSLISHNSRSARSASASSKGRSCRHCSDHRKSQAGRNSASRHRTRNSLGLDRCTKGAGCDAPRAKANLSERKLEGYYSVADDSPAGSRSRASVAPAGYEPAQPARRPAVSIGR
jgi:hypothetical protein